MIPDDEICMKLFEDTIKYGFVQLQPHETSAQQYFLNHRSTCSINKSAMARFRHHGLLDALFSDTIEASLQFKMSDSFKNMRSVTGDRTYGDWLELSPCGDVRNSSGMID